ncbi:MAG: hypothetical protein LBH17_04005 [Oscillospiraceae bacterium]|jgi:hypothetical protein|nr:hypothetical protein [Oscillospiraceae bacterium]
MEAIRKIVDARRLTPIVELPEHMLDSRVELIVMTLPEHETPRDERGSMKGALRKYANPELATMEKAVWESAAVEKHAGS